jgi:excisionase family DNA binding protein
MPLDANDFELVRAAAREAAAEVLRELRARPLIVPLSLSTSQAAKLIGISVSKLSRLRYSGRIRFISIDSAIRFFREDLERFLEESAIKPTRQDHH